MLKASLLWILTFPVNLLLLLAARRPSVGGQAIIEGVMMRGKNMVSWAVRKGPSEILVEQIPFISACKKTKILSKPVLRGAVNLYESLSLGYKALSRSAEIATEVEVNNSGKQQKSSSKKMEKFYSLLSFVFAMAVSIGLFMYAPMWLLSKVVPKESALLFNTFAGIIRLSLFLSYLMLISMWKEIRRIFEYHGAEHKAIFTFEDGKELNSENMRTYSTVHPRCGTSFLLLVMIFCIFLFSIIDVFFIHFFGPYPNVLTRLFVHLALIPLVGGTSYEILKLSDKYKNVKLVSLLIKPGLWLQKITTKEPDDKQMEVASLALKAVI